VKTIHRLHRFFFLIVWFCVICVICGNLLPAAFAQSKQRKKLKDFGSSLKRLKWNPQKKAVELDEPANIPDEDVIRIDTSLVSCELLVLDSRGNHVAGLTKDDFIIREESQPETVGHFLLGSNANVPRTIVLVIDYSGSQLPYLRSSISAAQLLVDKLGPNDRMAIVTDDVELLIDFTGDKKKLKEKLESLIERTVRKRGFRFLSTPQRIGRSKQYSALMATLNEAFEDADVRPIIIWQTDGDEAVFLRDAVVKMTIPPDLEGQSLARAQRNHELHLKKLGEQVTEFSLDDIYRAVEKSRATIYTVVPGISLMGLTLDQQTLKTKADLQKRNREVWANAPIQQQAELKARADRYEAGFSESQFRWNAEYRSQLQSALFPVASLTGGWTEFLETPLQADAIYTRIFSDINQRYIVGYYPSNKERDGKRRRIDFEVKGHPEYQIFGRRTYFAPTP
jgi:VWFA-related protein